LAKIFVLAKIFILIIENRLHHCCQCRLKKPNQSKRKRKEKQQNKGGGGVRKEKNRVLSLMVREKGCEKKSGKKKRKQGQ
jgi:hypothetical protein